MDGGEGGGKDKQEVHLCRIGDIILTIKDLHQGEIYQRQKSAM